MQTLENSESVEKATSPKGRRFRFGLRTMMAAMLVIAVGLGPLRLIQQANRQEQSVRILEANGFEIRYAHEFKANGDPIADPLEPGPKWLKKLVGRHVYLTPRELYYLDQKDFYPPADFDQRQIAQLKTLNKVDLGRYQLDDYAIVGQLEKLEYLRFRCARSSDLSPLARCRNLQELHIVQDQVGPKRALDLSFVAGLKKLKSIEINAWNGQSLDLAPLAELQDLQSATLRPVENLAPLKRLTNLEKLDIAFGRFDSLSELQGFFYLKELDVSFNKVADVTPLRNLKTLENIDLENTNVIDLSPLARLTSLRQLRLGEVNSPIHVAKGFSKPEESDATDLTPIQNLPDLKSLFLGNRKIKPGVLGEMTQLEQVSLSNGSEVDLNELRGLPHLKSLYLEAPPANYSNVVKEIPSLEILFVDGDQVDLAENLNAGIKN